MPLHWDFCGVRFVHGESVLMPLPSVFLVLKFVRGNFGMQYDGTTFGFFGVNLVQIGFPLCYLGLFGANLVLSIFLMSFLSGF